MMMTTEEKLVYKLILLENHNLRPVIYFSIELFKQDKSHSLAYVLSTLSFVWKQEKRDSLLEGL